TRLLAVAASRREGRRDDPDPGQSRKDQGQAQRGRSRRERHGRKAAAAAAGSDRAFDGAAKQGSPPRHLHSRAPGRTRRDRQSTGAAAQPPQGGLRAIIPAFPAAETSSGAETKTPLTGQG